MAQARFFLALTFLAASLVAVGTIPDTGNAARPGCAAIACVDAAASGGCPGCMDDNNSTDYHGATACAALCATMTAVLPAPTHVVAAAILAALATARPAPSGIPVAPERAPPRFSIPA